MGALERSTISRGAAFISLVIRVDAVATARKLREH
jgi:hypothetical protein